MAGDSTNIKTNDLIFVYPLQESLYINVTNQCPNACVFCIRHSRNGVGYNLWLEREPTAMEIIAAIGDLKDFKSIVFCGYGEPLLRPEVVIAVAAALKKRISSERRCITIRLNTNGLADLFLDYDILPQLQGMIDSVSISLNAHNPEEYQKLTQSKYGEQAFTAVLNFTRRSTLYIPKVIITAVRYPGADLAAVSKITEALGVEFRIREYQA